MDWVDYPKDRAALLDAVAITHGHMGHYIGLLHFGPESANVSRLPLLVTPRFSAFMAGNDPFRALISGNHMVPRNLLDLMRIDETAEVVGIPVPHRAEYTDTVAISIRVHGEPWLCYLPDIDSWQDWPDAESVLGQHNYALIDATFTSTAELPGRNIAEIPHPFVTDTIERFAHLTSSTSIVLTHINHSNPVADPSSTIAKKARARGFHIARDGLASSEI